MWDLIQCFWLCGGSSKQVDKVHRSDHPMPAFVLLNCISRMYISTSTVFFRYFSNVLLNCTPQMYFSTVFSTVHLNFALQLYISDNSQMYFSTVFCNRAQLLPAVMNSKQLTANNKQKTINNKQ